MADMPDYCKETQKGKKMKKKLRVMNLIWSMGDGGAQQVVLNYLRDFRDDPEIDFWLYVYTEPTRSKYDREIAEQEYNVVYLNNPLTKIQIPYIRRFFQRPVSRKNWARAIHDFAPDVVHVHISSLLAATMPGIERERIPVRFDTLHSSPYRYRGMEKRAIIKAFQKQNVIPVCVTNEQVPQAQECYGITRYEVVHNGVDVERLKLGCLLKSQARASLGISEESFVVLGVGRLNPIKRYDLLIDAFAVLHRRRPDSLLLFAGEGAEKERLRSKAERLGIGECVRFLGNVAELAGLYCSADVLAVTSESESSSLVAIEAQVCGLRCVLSAGVPMESTLLPQTHRLSTDATAEEWCDALLDECFIGTPVAREEDYEVHAMSRRMKKVYLKYALNKE